MRLPYICPMLVVLAIACSGPAPRPQVEVLTPDPLQYRRDAWEHWIDADGDCQNTRHEVLQDESLDTVTFLTDRKCIVLTGKWLDPFTGSVVTEAGRLDVDHMVPLFHAHISGGWAWDAERRRDYANSTEDPSHLIAVTAEVNRAKGGRGPDEWKPPNEDYWCAYATDWSRIKDTWGLSTTPAEDAALEAMLATCNGA